MGVASVESTWNRFGQNETPDSCHFEDLRSNCSVECTWLPKSRVAMKTDRGQIGDQRRRSTW